MSAKVREALLRRAPGAYGQRTLALYLLVALHACLTFTSRAPYGVRLQHLSLLGCLLPDHELLRLTLSTALRASFLVGAGLWIAQRWTPWSSWLAVASLTGFLSLAQDSYYYTQHQVHVVNMLLILYCGWYHLLRDELRAAAQAGTLATRPLFPAWVHGCALFYVAFSYSTSGWTKLLANGWGWANGAALQLWVWGADPAVPHLRELILEHRGLAAALQGAVLLAEAGALLALTHRFVRLGVGLVLLGFHVTGELIFGYGFYGNIAALLCVFLLPPKFPALASSSPGASA